MRILVNFLKFLLGIIGIGFLFFYVIPYIENEAGPSFLQKEDVPIPDTLHPVVQENKVKLVNRAEEKGIAVVITDGHRSVGEQDTLYEQGRSEDGRIVTYAEGGESYHNYGLAIDFAIETKDGRVVWDMNYDGNDNGQSDWMEVVETAKDLGFTWGGDWENFKDYPHLQMDFGLSIRELQYGKRPDVEDYAK
ncbi:M15 family metallopeptidase [Halobacillus kuroshimensis]|uniref:M15 family metallopeptidase n=1 Tax=Halobacillus kuroshimensis TaxID=302481 RepID=A0ABS3DXI8_9BACI|nr:MULTISPECIES: M15 family metallopeptidase [Halobacillus]MBN8235958.1 M15 family metallopeptidase [Halobacillus kuroshimensis]